MRRYQRPKLLSPSAFAAAGNAVVIVSVNWVIPMPNTSDELEVIFSAEGYQFSSNSISVSPEKDVTLEDIAATLVFEYTVNSDNTVSITGYVGDGGPVIIPTTLNGYM